MPGAPAPAEGRPQIAERLLLCASGAIGVANLHEYLIALRPVTGRAAVVMTRTARTLCSERAIRALTGHQVYTDDAAGDLTVPHLQLAHWADVVVVLPASANVLGKAANGIADDLVSSILLARSTPAIFVPSMNPAMWANPAVRRNVERLRADGHDVVVADTPARALETATGDWVLTDLMPPPSAVVEQIATLVAGRPAVVR
jgi:phosphopantothenoylcysteine synthetase/decarboxylase